ncbi:helix-turn-helix domain-containing protein [Mycobacterium avium]
MLTPVLEPHERLTPGAQDVVGHNLRAEYEKGTSIRELASQTGYSIRRVRTLLTQAGTEIRAPGKHQ